MQWFTVIGRELHDPASVPENVYNMDETGVLLSVLNSLKVLVSKQDLTNCRGTAVKRTLVPAIECISAGGKSPPPLIILSGLLPHIGAPGLRTRLLDGTSHIRRLGTPIHIQLVLDAAYI